MYKEFGTASLDWNSKPSKLEQAKIDALKNRGNETKS
jgi:hypothetical protein